jgi:hypothetical protein
VPALPSGGGHHRPFRWGLPDAEDQEGIAGVVVEAGERISSPINAEGIFGVIDEEDLRHAIFDVCWTQHGGSGLGFTYQDVMGMTLDELGWYRNAVAEERKREQAAIRNARRKRS